jgi:hypothetical protein
MTSKVTELVRIAARAAAKQEKPAHHVEFSNHARQMIERRTALERGVAHR